MELIEEESTEVDLRHDLVRGNRRLLQAVGLGVLVLLLILLLRPSDPVGSVASTTTTQLEVASAAEDGIDQSRPAGSPSQTLVRPDRIDILPSVALAGPSLPFTLVGKNNRGQIVMVDLASGAATEVDRPSGQLFRPRVASDRRVAGFRVFLGENISLGSDGTLRTMPVTEMDLPTVFRAADGNGFVIHETLSNALWAESDDGSVIALEPMPPDVVLRAVVAGGLVVATNDGVDRRFDPLTGDFGSALIGRVLALGTDRYLSQTCDDGACVMNIRSLDDDSVLAPIDLQLTRGDRLAISPSGALLAATSTGEVVIFDLETGEQLRRIDRGNQPQFSWGPDDQLLYWLALTGTGPGTVVLFDPDGGVVDLSVITEVLDPTQPLHLIRS